MFLQKDPTAPLMELLKLEKHIQGTELFDGCPLKYECDWKGKRFTSYFLLAV